MRNNQDSFEKTNAIQIFVAMHHLGDHRAARVKGCAYCYPPGPDGQYRGTTWAEMDSRREHEEQEYVREFQMNHWAPR